MIEAKLTQQLAYIEQAPFYGVFINLKKAFDAMDQERCLFILEGCCREPFAQPRSSTTRKERAVFR